MKNLKAVQFQPAKPVKLRSPKTRFSDERIITVTSALGALMGQFLWHADDLQVIKELEKNSRHCNIHIETPNH